MESPADPPQAIPTGIDTVLFRLLILTLVPFLVLAITIVLIARPQIEPLIQENALAGLRSTNSVAAAIADEWYDDQIEMLLYAARWPEAQAWDTDGMERRARELATGFGSLTAVVFADTEGTVIVDSAGGSPGASVLGRTYFQEALLGRSATSGVIIARTNQKPTIVFSVPVRNPSGEVIGVVFAPVQHFEFVTNLGITGDSTTSHTFLVDQRRVIMTGPDAGTGIATEHLPGQEPGIAYESLAGEEVYGVVTPLRAGWRVITEIPAATPAAEFRQYDTIVTSAMIVCLVIGVTIAILIALSVQKPVTHLAMLAQRIEQGRSTGTEERALMPSAPIELRYLNDRMTAMARTIAVRRKELQESNAQLERVAAEKSVLFQEVQHRVRNNLATMESILSLQRGRLSEGSEAYQALEDSEARVRSMAVLHRQLYETGSVAGVDLASYLDALTINLRQGHGRPGIDLTCHGESRIVDVSLASACGLIVTELVVNAYKYAFPTGGGTITVSTVTSGPDEITLTVADDGVGKPETDTSSEGLGTQLVGSLIEQIRGTCQVTSSGGTRNVIRFPAPETTAN